MPRLLRVEHCPQMERAGCLAACAQMALQHVWGYDEAQVFLNDPDQPTAPVVVSWGDLMLAWSEFDYKYTLIYAG